MKESLGQAFLVNIILVFLGILLLLLFYSVNYSRAFKAKNRIIYVIEKYGTFNQNTKVEVDDNMAKAGYITASNYTYCDKYSKNKNNITNIYPEKYQDQNKVYKYCIFERQSGNANKYYQVITFMKFEVPFIGWVLEFPVKGETRNLFNNLD